jgi:hypothetical protein
MFKVKNAYENKNYNSIKRRMQFNKLCLKNFLKRTQFKEKLCNK